MDGDEARLSFDRRELDAYPKRGHRGADFVARALGVDEPHVERALEALADSGQIENQRGR